MKRKEVEDTAAFLVEQVGAIGLHAMTVGDRDLLLGVDTLRKLERKAKFPLLSANLVDAASGRPLFRARTLVTEAGVKVGVFGVTTKQAMHRGPGEPTWKVEDPIAAAREQVAALKGEGAQVVVALAHLSEDEAAELAQQVPGITAILGGHGQRMMQHPDQVGATFVAEAFSKGKLLSTLVLHVWTGRDAASGFIDRFKKEGLRSRLQQVEAQIASYERMVEARKAQGDAPEGKADAGPRRARAPQVGVRFYEEQLVKLRADRQLLELELEDAPEPDPKANFIRYATVQLGRTIEDEPKVHAAVESFRKKYPKAKGH